MQCHHHCYRRPSARASAVVVLRRRPGAAPVMARLRMRMRRRVGSGSTRSGSTSTSRVGESQPYFVRRRRWIMMVRCAHPTYSPNSLHSPNSPHSLNLPTYLPISPATLFDVGGRPLTYVLSRNRALAGGLPGRYRSVRGAGAQGTGNVSAFDAQPEIMREHILRNAIGCPLHSVDESWGGPVGDTMDDALNNPPVLPYRWL